MVVLNERLNLPSRLPFVNSPNRIFLTTWEPQNMGTAEQMNKEFRISKCQNGIYFNHALKRSEKIISEGNRRSRFMTRINTNLGAVIFYLGLGFRFEESRWKRRWKKEGDFFILKNLLTAL